MEKNSLYGRVKKNFIRICHKIFYNVLEPKSIFRIVDKPKIYLKTQHIDGKTFLVTYIRCDICLDQSEEVEFDYWDRKWKCGNCKI